MNRTSALIGTAAAAAALVAGSVAAVAAVNTATSSAPRIDNIAVVDDQPLAVGSLAPIDIAPLPQIVPISAQAPVIATRVDNTSVAASPSAKSGQASSKPTLQTSATPAPLVSQSPRSMTSDQAAGIVMGQIDGSAKVAEVSRTEHAGYDSWAVTVDKADGSRLVGYVFTGATGAEVFDWKVLKEPRPIVVKVPAPNEPAAAKPSKSNYNDDDDDDEHESGNHESHEGDDDDD